MRPIAARALPSRLVPPWLPITVASSPCSSASSTVCAKRRAVTTTSCPRACELAHERREERDVRRVGEVDEQSHVRQRCRVGSDAGRHAGAHGVRRPRRPASRVIVANIGQRDAGRAEALGDRQVAGRVAEVRVDRLQVVRVAVVDRRADAGVLARGHELRRGARCARRTGARSARCRRRPGAARRARRVPLRRTSRRPGGGARSTRRPRAGCGAGRRPGARRGGCCSPTCVKVCLSLLPWKRSIRASSATSSRLVAISPPSPKHGRFLVGKKLKVAASPNAPALVPSCSAPHAWAASSSTARPRSFASALSAVMSATWPNRCTGTIARVLPVTFGAHVVDVEAARRGIDVGEDGRRADRADRLGRREEGVGRADDLVARADAQAAQRDAERVGAVRDADRVLDAQVLGGLLLEALDLGAEDEAARSQHARRDLLELRPCTGRSARSGPSAGRPSVVLLSRVRGRSHTIEWAKRRRGPRVAAGPSNVRCCRMRLAQCAIASGASTVAGPGGS